MGLSLVVGPAHAGKVALLLDRFVAALDHDPWLIVPNRVDVDRVERELAAEVGLCSPEPSARSTACSRSSPASHPGAPRSAMRERNIVLRHLIAAAPPGSLGPSARFAGFADSLAGVLTEIEASLLDPEDLGPGLADADACLPRRARAALGVRDRGMVRRRAVERLTSELGSWHGAPVFAYGFEDLTGAEWRLIEALAARGEVHVSLPYEPGRAAFASLSRTVADLGGARRRRHRRARRRLRRLPAAGLAHLERHLFDDAPRRRRSTARCASSRAPAAARRSSSSPRPCSSSSATAVAPDEIAIVCPSLERSRASIETAFGALGVPVSIETRRAPGVDGRRPGAALAAPLHVEQRDAARALLLPPDAVFAASAAATSTSSRAGCAGARLSVATAPSRR